MNCDTAELPGPVQSESCTIPEKFIQLARGIHAGDELERSILEARILARLSDAEIGERTGVPAGAVAAYESKFFSVRSRLDAPHWIALHAIAMPTDGSPAPLGAVLRKFGYCGGSVALEFLVPIVLRSRGRDILDSLPDLSTAAGRTELSARLAVAIEMLPQNNATAMFFIREHTALMRRELELRRLGALPGTDGRFEAVNLTATLSSIREHQRGSRRARDRRRKIG